MTNDISSRVHIYIVICMHVCVCMLCIHICVLDSRKPHCLERFVSEGVHAEQARVANPPPCPFCYLHLSYVSENV